VPTNTPTLTPKNTVLVAVATGVQVTPTAAALAWAPPCTGKGGYKATNSLYTGLALMVAGTSVSLLAMKRRDLEETVRDKARLSGPVLPSLSNVPDI
jgi:hypothetical protein